MLPILRHVSVSQHTSRLYRAGAPRQRPRSATRRIRVYWRRAARHGTALVRRCYTVGCSPSRPGATSSTRTHCSAGRWRELPLTMRTMMLFPWRMTRPASPASSYRATSGVRVTSETPQLRARCIQSALPNEVAVALYLQCGATARKLWDFAGELVRSETALELFPVASATMGPSD